MQSEENRMPSSEYNLYKLTVNQQAKERWPNTIDICNTPEVYEIINGEMGGSVQVGDEVAFRLRVWYPERHILDVYWDEPAARKCADCTLAGPAEEVWEGVLEEKYKGAAGEWDWGDGLWIVIRQVGVREPHVWPVAPCTKYVAGVCRGEKMLCENFESAGARVGDKQIVGCFPWQASVRAGTFGSAGALEEPCSPHCGGVVAGLDRCPLCGSEGKDLVFVFECKNAECANYVGGGQ
jgi:hypothetical protein